MSVFTAYPNCKINLGLLIKGKRADGYHLLETVMYPVFDLKDKLEIRESKGDGSFSVSGIELSGDATDNLCLKAFRILRERFPDLPPVDIHLEKNIPAGAGLGGGSSDAAFTLQGINTLFQLGLSDAALAKAGEKLGADVPFFIYNTPLLATGIGTDFEKVEINLTGYSVRILTPPIHSSTVAAYKALDYRMFNPERSLISVLGRPVTEWKELLENDLEVPVFGLYPELARIKQQLYEEGAVYAAMSGSGSAVFGIFKA
ncbi:MAG: 4-(cytidine 5'-diphospho)-2-C-methyl-D-erythritol kinase [Bacteroidia bacterium]|nr:4-(cytidine 5'-diphospho)-2-C-methyl-D-erythritol kinase [Bacteroidia bacterium]